jgi:hypothetical protein
MSDKIETIKYRGYDIETFYDTDYQSPDDWGNEDAFVVYDHRDFNVKRDGFDPREIFEQLQETKRYFYDGYYVFPLYAYIHSGVSLSLGRNSYPFTCQWDTSYAGFVLVKREKGNWSKAKAEKLAQAIVDEWNMCLSGDVYGYSSEAFSCWGFYGKEGYDEMIKDAKSEIDSLIKKKIADHLEQLKTWIRNRVPVIYRQPLSI